MSRRDVCALCKAPVGYSIPELEGYRTCSICDVTWCLADDPSDVAHQWDKDYYKRDNFINFHEARRSAMDAIVKRLCAIAPNRGRLLDIGTGPGILLEIAAKAGWLVEGIEPSKAGAERARQLTGYTVYEGILEEIDLPSESYDAVTIIDVLRHVQDPCVFLQCARKLVRSGGVLVIRENYRAMSRRSRWLWGQFSKQADPNARRAFEYAQCFSPKSLIYALRANGLDGWIEPSPVFHESGTNGRLIASLSRRSIGLISKSLYRASGRKFIVSPNLLAFGHTAQSSRGSL